MTIINIETRQKEHFFKIAKNFPFDIKDVLLHALQYFYAIRHDGRIPQPPEYNPILLYDVLSCFDPYIMNGSQTRQLIPNSNEQWVQWPSFIGLQRTKIFIDEVLIPRRILFKDILSKLEGYNPINALDRQDILSKYLMYAKEDISDNEIILNIVNNKTNKLKRVHIKDLRRVCILLSALPGTFPKILGYDRNKLKIDGRPRTEFDKDEIFKWLDDAAGMPFHDDNVYEILKRTGVLDTKIYNIG